MKARERRYLGKLLGESTAGRGRVSEQSLLTAVRHEGAKLPWFLFARKANEQEDAEGIDIVVFGRDGLVIRLQAKSSHARAEDFKRRKSEIEVVVVSLDDEKTRRRAREALVRAKERSLT